MPALASSSVEVSENVICNGYRVEIFSKSCMLSYLAFILYFWRIDMISYAYAQNAAAQDPLISLLPLILMFVVLYFLMIRPQMKRAKEHKNLVENLQKQDEIITSSGIVGKIININSTYITLEVGDTQNKTEVIVKRQAAETLLPKGTIKEIF
ncbi:MAG: hypothetical protein CM15mP58_11890 [Burkholderiaceae bacterium]|nr:MAG: hypothetical protein CM15mP58_11890 [Burkholderiaceae bacterium]